jgi:hypothetical protein
MATNSFLFGCRFRATRLTAGVAFALAQHRGYGAERCEIQTQGPRAVVGGGAELAYVHGEPLHEVHE